MVLRYLKLTFFLSLFSICFFGFGLPCIQRFFDNEISVKEFVEKRSSLKAPSITVCPLMWKTDVPPIIPKGHYKKNCRDADDTKDFEECVRNNTFGIDEVIVDATQGYKSSIVRHLPVSDSRLWTSDMTMTMPGRCYTLNYDQLLKVDQETEAVVVDLVPGNYYLYLHHPDFFLFTINPLTMPTTAVDLQVMNASYLGLVLEMVQVNNLNLVQHGCTFAFIFSTYKKKTWQGNQLGGTIHQIPKNKVKNTVAASHNSKEEKN